MRGQQGAPPGRYSGAAISSMYARMKGESMKALQGEIARIHKQALEKRAALNSHTGRRTEPQVQHETAMGSPRHPPILARIPRSARAQRYISGAKPSTSRKGTGSAAQTPKAPCQTQVHVLGATSPRHIPTFPVPEREQEWNITTPAYHGSCRLEAGHSRLENMKGKGAGTVTRPVSA